ncbi:hypothetical protein JCM8547_002601 [Rhodosporidiobolus lusitaniae]
MLLVNELLPEILDRIFAYAGLDDVGQDQVPDYSTLSALPLVCQGWRGAAQDRLLRHIRIASPEAMQALRSRETKRLLALHRTAVLEVHYQWGSDVYWCLDRFTALKGFSLSYDPVRGSKDGQAERDDEWLTWDVLRHPSLVGITYLYCNADFQEPDDTSLLTLPLTHLSLGCLPLENSPSLHKALFSGCKDTLQSVSLSFLPTMTPAKPALDNLIEEFQLLAPTIEHLSFLNKPEINFLMSLHSKMSAVKMKRFYSCTYPLLSNALAPFNILALAAVNNGSALAEFRLSEADPSKPESEEAHEALVLRYIAAFGSRLDSFNMMGRRFKFVFPREWSAQFVRRPEIARFIDRAGARGCDVQCGAEQKFLSTAKAMEKRKGKRAAAGGGDDSNEPEEDPAASFEQILQQAAAQATVASTKSKGKGKASLGEKSKGKGKVVDKGKGKAVDKGKGKAVDRKGKGKAVAE